jgi:replicative DNA helicase
MKAAEASQVISQMRTWDTSEVEDSFLASCVYFLEEQIGSADQLCEIVASVNKEWFSHAHKKAVFYVVRRIVLGSGDTTFVIPGSIAMMAEKILVAGGHVKECEHIQSVTNCPSLFFDVQSLASIIPLWRIKLTRRQLRDNAEQIIDLLDADPDPEVFENQIPNLIEAQQETWHNASVSGQSGASWEETIENVLMPLPDDISMSTGLKVLDEEIQGGIAKRYSVYSGRLIVIAARPSMGKTAVSVCIATSLARYSGDVAFFSLEMSTEQVRYRAIACYDYLTLKDDSKLTNPIRLGNLRHRSYTPDQRQRLQAIGGSGFIQRFHIFDIPESLSTIAAKIKLLCKTRKNLSAVFIDYLQLIDGCSGDATNSEASKIGDVTKALKRLARSFGIDIILLSQLNRGVENRNDKMPNLADLRASGRIEEDSDIVMFLLRPYYYDKEKDPYELAIGVAKNREGNCGVLQCSIEVQSSVVFDRTFR